ncbi:beta-N-acetylglucosaminidase domain-containing protein [Elizabethkingia sp. JS20170427COW]|uniref:beta-N-acetylhexosaminidase family protein n=1 Tax=Elizabethkingia sp. JS20170427COW TaxID=2583851 RepID=UPI001110EA1B|nr:beta-N-acetylglucosaminidase domain-containing protein [Elizabethkingia sp. JS20170427COW]QCX53993.1 O-GlcNAcase [Elizabethkingia sp. JS20170427COW]
MRYLFKSLLLGGLSISSLHFAQSSNADFSIYPRVQKMEDGITSQVFEGFQLKSKAWENLVQRTPVQKMLSDKGNWKLQISLKKELASDKNPQNIAKAKGAYEIDFKKNTIHLFAKEEAGIFYGLQTLSQLVKGDKILPVDISDFPTIQYRGVVEGFYGNPWSHEDRISQLKYYGQIKANTYIYGPKDDPYHSSPNWRKPYPPQQAQQLQDLVKTAHDNFVDFVWAIHPGKDIQWTEEDQNNVLKKFEEMYKLGIRSYAVFFDDISGEGTNAHKQAGLMNFLNEKFVKVKKDVNPLMICPTEYNKSWADPKPGTYLDILGTELDPSIQIMWTGDSVVADVTKNTLEWIQKRIKRPALIWWNFPVNDYVRDHLLLGPSYGLEANIDAKEMSGLLSNPMEHAEASKPAIFGVADFAWKTNGYNSQKAWQKSIEDLLPLSSASYEFFAENNSDLGKTGHGYRREESTQIAPVIQQLKQNIIEGKEDVKNLEVVKDYYQQAIQATYDIEAKNENPNLNTEIKAWLNDFNQLGQKGISQIENYKTRNLSIAEYWNTIVSHYEKTKDFKSLHPENEPNITPVTGTLVLRPFVEFLENWNHQNIFEKITQQKGQSASNPGVATLHTTVKSLQAVKIKVGKDQQIYLQPILEVFEMKPKEEVTLELTQPISHTNIKTQFETGATQWAGIEVSSDGKTWEKVNAEEKQKTITAHVERSFRWVKLSNVSQKPVRLRLKEFSVLSTHSSAHNQTLYVRDLNLNTYSVLATGQGLKEVSPISQPKEIVILSYSDAANLQLRITNSRNKTIKVAVSGNYIHYHLPKDTKAIEVVPNKETHLYEILWK